VCGHHLARLTRFPQGLGVESKPFRRRRLVIQRILRHSNVATAQNHYIETASPDAIAAMKQFSETLTCSACAPDGNFKAQGIVCNS
jgi:hypothetical protein